MPEAQSIIETIEVLWPVILGSVGVALITSFIFINFLRFFTGIITWLLIIATVTVFFVSGVYFLIESRPEFFD